ncbi:MAG: EthD family reductase [Acidimicrobiales bacterium]|nr:EthD family reductase [Acidimicrobiales bacterium]
MTDDSTVKIVYLVTKRDDLTDAAFMEHWTTVHAESAARMPDVVAYSINSAVTSQIHGRVRDGYAMLRFASYDQAKASWQSPQGKATAEDGALFMARTEAIIVEEIVLQPIVGLAPRLKVVHFMSKYDDISNTEYTSRWSEALKTFAASTEGVVGAEVNLPSPLQRGPRPFDGYSVVWFESEETGWQALGEGQDQLGPLLTPFAQAAPPLVVEERRVVDQGAE